MGNLDNTHRSTTSDTLQITDAMRKKAIELLPFAQSCAEAQTTRIAFFKTSQKWLNLDGGKAYLEAKESEKRAHARLSILEMVATGVSNPDERMVTQTQWEETIRYFAREFSNKAKPYCV